MSIIPEPNYSRKVHFYGPMPSNFAPDLIPTQRAANIRMKWPLETPTHHAALRTRLATGPARTATGFGDSPPDNHPGSVASRDPHIPPA